MDVGGDVGRRGLRVDQGVDFALDVVGVGKSLLRAKLVSFLFEVASVLGNTRWTLKFVKVCGVVQGGIQDRFSAMGRFLEVVDGLAVRSGVLGIKKGGVQKLKLFFELGVNVVAGDDARRLDEARQRRIEPVDVGLQFVVDADLNINDQSRVRPNFYQGVRGKPVLVFLEGRLVGQMLEPQIFLTASTLVERRLSRETPLLNGHTALAHLSSQAVQFRKMGLCIGFALQLVLQPCGVLGGRVRGFVGVLCFPNKFRQMKALLFLHDFFYRFKFVSRKNTCTVCRRRTPPFARVRA